MNFIQQMRRFDELSYGNLTPNAIAIYLHLFLVNNRCGWAEWFTESDSWIERAVGISRRESVLKAINLLRQKGFIDFERGGMHKPTRYHIIPLFNSAIDSAIDSPINSPISSAINSAINSALDSDNPKHKTKTKNINKARDVFAESNESDTVKGLLADLDESRKSNKKKMTNKAKELLLKKLNDLSNGDERIKITMLEKAIEHGWLTVYPLKENEKPSPCQADYPIHQGDDDFGLPEAV